MNSIANIFTKKITHLQRMLVKVLEEIKNVSLHFRKIVFIFLTKFFDSADDLLKQL